MSDENKFSGAELPGDVSNKANTRAYDIEPSENLNQYTITLYKIDQTIYNHFVNTIKPTIIQGDRSIDVPIMWANPERWKSIRTDGVLRDESGKIQLPLIAIQRTGASKDTTMPSSVNKYLRHEFITGWNKSKIYDKFSIQNQIAPSRKYVSIVAPDYVLISYDLLIWTEYLAQLNELVEQISFEADEYWGETGKYRFRVSVGDYKLSHELPPDGDRLVRATISLEVKAYLLPEKMVKGFEQKTGPTAQERFSPKKVLFGVEVVETINPLSKDK